MRLIPPALVLALCLPASVQAQVPDAQALSEKVNAHVIAWRRQIHANPELSNREFKTSKLVADHLRSLGLEVRTGIAHTGVVAIIKGGKPGPRIALRADMDALPVTERSSLPFASKATAIYNGETVGVMHACGHDAHTSILMGVAEALVSVRKDLPGEVMLIFQPAEEGAPEGETGGAKQMLAEGLFADFKPEAVFGLHVHSTVPVGQVGYRSGPFMAAADSFRIVVKGRQTHGARPWLGVDPIVAASDLVGTAQTIVSRRMNLASQPVVLSFGMIKGGLRSNIIPDQVELIGTIRTFDPAMREQAFAELRRVAENTAAAHGATVELKIPDADGYPSVYNHPELLARILPSVKKAVGAENVREIPLSTGGEDFSMYGQLVPAVFLYVGVTAKGVDPATAAPNHSPLFTVDEGGLAVGTRTLLQISLDYLNASTPR
ncbi:MAG: amidohydrolase [Gammaproteobacteria bacterium]|nr:amidohydrolase [Gammaproteobacteria bacterium]